MKTPVREARTRRTTWPRALASAALDLLFPPRCVACGRGGSFLCAVCLTHATPVPEPRCSLCGQPIAGGPLCSRCAESPVAGSGLRSVFVYAGPVQAAVRALKYHNLRVVASPLGVEMARYLQAWGVGLDIVVPVPLHPRRLRERGYNQAELLARALGKETGLSVQPEALARVRDTPAQARAPSAAERRRNVTGAFSAREVVRGRRALLVDDVCTTGATLSACAEALLAAGAAQVWGLTVAREP
ncbi:MAG: ComF family protein [Chloroflexota bacterium]